MANIPFSGDLDIVELMNRLLDEAAARRVRHQNHARPLTPIQSQQRPAAHAVSPIRPAA